MSLLQQLLALMSTDFALAPVLQSMPARRWLRIVTTQTCGHACSAWSRAPPPCSHCIPTAAALDGGRLEVGATGRQQQASGRLMRRRRSTCVHLCFRPIGNRDAVQQADAHPSPCTTPAAASRRRRRRRCGSPAASALHRKMCQASMQNHGYRSRAMGRIAAVAEAPCVNP